MKNTIERLAIDAQSALADFRRHVQNHVPQKRELEIERLHRHLSHLENRGKGLTCRLNELGVPQLDAQAFVEAIHEAFARMLRREVEPVVHLAAPSPWFGMRTAWSAAVVFPVRLSQEVMTAGLFAEGAIKTVLTFGMAEADRRGAFDEFCDTEGGRSVLALARHRTLGDGGIVYRSLDEAWKFAS